jgi:thioredoxin 1
MMDSTIEELAKKYGKDIKFIKVEITDKQDISEEHNIQGVPAFATFENGKKKNSFSGADKQKLKSMVKKLAKAD